MWGAAGKQWQASVLACVQLFSADTQRRHMSQRMLPSVQTIVTHDNARTSTKLTPTWARVILETGLKPPRT